MAAVRLDPAPPANQTTRTSPPHAGALAFPGRQTGAFLGSCVRDFGYSGVEESGSAVSILMSAVMAFETSFMLATGIRTSFPCPSEA